jgi:simple sugar transport system substrate-binding protein
MEKWFMSAAVFCTVAVLFAGFASAKEPLRFVFITCCKDEAFFDPVKKGIADAARQMNVRCEFTGTPGVDVKAQAEMVRKAAAEGYDGIALNSIDANAFNDVVDEVMRKGVPVVAFNTDASEAAGAGLGKSPHRNVRLGAVCQDFVQAGRTLATKALEFIPPGSKVLLTQHDHGIAALDDRLRGIQEVLRRQGVTWKVICSTNDLQKAVELIAGELKANADIHLVLGTGQTDTEAAGRVIERDFPGQGCASAGFDLSPEILRLIHSGVIRLTIDQQPYIQGFYPVVQLTLYCRYGIRPCKIDAGAGVITPKDVERVLELSRQQYR